MEKLSEFLHDVIDEAEPYAVVGRPETVRMHDGEGEIDIVWHFRDAVPDEFEYRTGPKTCSFEGDEITCRFECIVHPSEDYWLDEKEPHFFFYRAPDSPDGELDFSILRTLTDEVVIDSDDFASIIEDVDDQDRVALVTLSAVTTEAGQSVQEVIETGDWRRVEADSATLGEISGGLKFSVIFGSKYHFLIDDINSRWRFDHIQAISLDDGTIVPAEVQTGLFPEASFELGQDSEHGQVIHTGDLITEYNPIDHLEFRDELARIDLQELIESDRLYPDPPSEWSEL